MFRKLQFSKLLTGFFVLMLTQQSLGSELLFIKEEADGKFTETRLILGLKGKVTEKKSVFDPDQKIALGSLWKLFIYVYLIDTKQTPPDYQCSGNNIEEKFCCPRGGSVDLHNALIKSCGLFFSQSRIQISSKDWSEYWRKRVSGDGLWILDYPSLEAETQAPLGELLLLLKQIRLTTSNRLKLEQTLSQTSVIGTGKQGLKELGTKLKFKTFSWRRKGGAAGWMSDGRTFYFSGAGKSSDVLSRWAKSIAKLSDAGNSVTDSNLVNVKFFDRYPVSKIFRLNHANRQVRTGLLKGTFEVLFENGNKIQFYSDNKIALQKRGSQFLLTGKFSIDEYVARVIDREINSEPEEAAKAFSILIRTYLVNNAKKTYGSYEIPDSSRFQRVSIHSPSPKSMKIAEWGHGLILKDTVDLTYHLNQEGRHKMSWAKANMMALSGVHFLDILKTHFEVNNLVLLQDDLKTCQRVTFLERWIDNNRLKWKKSFTHLDGFFMPEKVTVCQSQNGKQYADLESNTIYLNYDNGTEDLLTAAHEYLHLAFKNHPRTNDEAEIEFLAKKLILGTGDTI